MNFTRNDDEIACKVNKNILLQNLIMYELCNVDQSVLSLQTRFLKTLTGIQEEK